MKLKSVILNELVTKNRLIVGYQNINFIENKFEALVSLVKDKFDIIMVSETKIDDSFQENQFLIDDMQNISDRILILMVADY